MLKSHDYLNIKINAEEYPDFYQLKTIFLKILWILFVFKENEVMDSVTIDELYNVLKKKHPHKFTKSAIQMALRRSKGEIDYEVKNGAKRYYITRIGENLLLQKTKKSFISKKSIDIKNMVNKIKNEEDKEYFKEALACYEKKAYRGAIVLVWIVCMWHSYKEIEKNGFNKFNNAVQQRYPKVKKKVKKIGDLQYYRDNEILFICEDLGLIDKNLRSELKQHLDLRNHCAHPGAYKPKEMKVLGLFEDIIENILKL